jgi:ABC-type antimicrobial peptide transport system permease subunit
LVRLPSWGVALRLTSSRLVRRSSLERSRAVTRFNTQLAGVFAGLALLLSAMGVYSLTSGEVAARKRELAVRIALGAFPRSALWAVMRRCAAVMATGAALGVGGAFAAAPLLASLLHGVGPADAATLLAAPSILVSVGLAAAALATAPVFWIAPAETLREE